MSDGFNDGERLLSAAAIRARLESLTSGVTLTSGVATTVDSLAVDTYEAAEWIVVLEKAGARRIAKVLAVNDGRVAADATAATYTEFGDEDVGTVDVVLSVDVSGAGTSQVMRLRALASSAGWTARAWRTPFLPTAA